MDAFIRVNGDKLNYVVIEVVYKKDKTVKSKGIFLGYQPLVKDHTQIVSKLENFFWLYRNNNIYMLNNSHYDISMIEFNTDHVSTSYMPTSVTQDSYIKNIKLVQECFKKSNRVLKNGLIDISKCKIPEKLYKSLSSTDDNKVIDHTKNKVVDNSSNNKTTTNANTVYKRKVVETFVFKRTTKYSISKALETMKQKIEDIQNGVYKPPELQPLIDSTKDVDKEKENVIYYGGI